MTEEQIQKNALEYSQLRHYSEEELFHSITSPEEVIRLAFVEGAYCRDEEIKHLEELLERAECDMIAYKAQADQLRNPWISVEEHPDDVTKDYLLEYEDGSHIVAMWDSGMWMSKNLHPLKEPTHWMKIPELNK